ncbi:MAG: hypothetical protein HN833_01855 [Elusimicrobiaceae bacterium]|jgi:nitrogen fixation/metabolism regulation signal transduction histidine kinase|nr:hypothetical protein [Elusimicrobiaceae bacterium]MBT3955503.1 hypothetical protein [Elusimicrobiaceae bacterium]MBT4008541.1 hypothetical protein [Elusimicrobiaceae bacterium]MBT4402386.1 hypothetical protein [Elusimicrobiaceae bacterium]MBT4440342.1 hypothetical protein [Elusimicrobiaceae bacterium]
MEKFQRKTIFIKKKLQYRYMLLIILSVLVGFAIVFFEFSVAISDAFAKEPALLQPLIDQMSPTMIMFGIKILIYIIFIILFSAVLSNRLAGPIYHFERVCRSIKETGKIRKVHLRKGDQFTTLQKEFNDMLDVLDKKREGTK